MKFKELVKLPVVRSVEGKMLQYEIYNLSFIVEDYIIDPAYRALSELGARIDILYEDDNNENGGEVIVLYLNGCIYPVLVYQFGDSWNEEDALFVFQEESYRDLQALVTKYKQPDLKVWDLEDEVPAIYGANPRLIDGQLWHPNGTPRKYSNW